MKTNKQHMTLQNLKHGGKKRYCTGFECVITDGEEINQKFTFCRTLDVNEEPTPNWLLAVTVKPLQHKETENWYIYFVMPKAEMPLDLICATGLRYFQMYLKEDIQQKMNLDFLLGEATAGM